MSNNKHMDISDRIEIEKGLKEGLSFKAIAKLIDKDCTTIFEMACMVAQRYPEKI